MASRNRSFSIRSIANRNSKISTDIDNFKDRYIDIDGPLELSVILPGFDIRTFDKNLFLLLAQSDQIDFNVKWEMRPDYVSYEYYGIEIYWPLIMYVNGCFLIEEFKNFDKILVPPRAAITELGRYREVDKSILPLLEPEKINIKAIQFFKNYPYSGKLNQKSIADENLTNLNDTTSTTSPVVTTTSQLLTFTINSENIENGYIDLPTSPDSITSLFIYYNNFKIPLKYNFDYVLTFDSNNENRRIAWDKNIIIAVKEKFDSAVNNNTGLRRLIKLNDILTVKYTNTIYVT